MHTNADFSELLLERITDRKFLCARRLWNYTPCLCSVLRLVWQVLQRSLAFFPQGCHYSQQRVDRITVFSTDKTVRTIQWGGKNGMIGRQMSFVSPGCALHSCGCECMLPAGFFWGWKIWICFCTVEELQRTKTLQTHLSKVIVVSKG